MDAGRYVGRIGGLAVALGIGSALFMGHAVASAEPADSSQSDAPSSSATETSTATDTSASTATDKSADTDDPGIDATDQTDDFGDPDDFGDTDDTDDSEGLEDDESAPDDETEQSPTTQKHSNERWETDQDDEATSDSSDESEPGAVFSSTQIVEGATTSDDVKTTESVPAVGAPQPTAYPAPATVMRSVTMVVEPTTTWSATPAEPAETEPPVVATVSHIVSALVGPNSGLDGAPAGPADTPLGWTLAAAARRELAAVTVEEPQPRVVAVASVPLLTPLQYIPVVGPLFVTPVVAVLKQLPFIGDILHPLIGYPIGFTGGTTPRDVVVYSADGTPIYVHFFPAQGVNKGKVAPTILNGPGLGLPGETNPLAEDNPFMPNDVIGMAPLLRSGYNVVTWDPRGEWQSGGVLQIDHPDYEGRDMQAIISWLAEQPEALLDATGDPRVGMVGASYGGGIQLVTAAIDKRVDAIAPTIAWNNLNTSLYKAEATKTSWGAILTAALLLTGSRSNPNIYAAVATGLLTGRLTDAQVRFLDERSPDRLLGQITAPTLLLQGTVDTLFSLQEAHENAEVLLRRGVPTKVVWFCGGHGACISGEDGTLVERATMNWLDRYVKREPVSTGPQFEWVDQHGRIFGSDTYPVKRGPSLQVATATNQNLPLWPLLGGSGPNFRALQAGPIGALLGILSASEAVNAVELTLPRQATTQYLVGAPQLAFTYSGTGVSRHVYAQLVDDTTGLVLGNQVTPIPVILDGRTRVATVPLEQIAHTLAPGQTVTLQIVASAVQYQRFLSWGAIKVTSIELSLPTADAATVMTTPSADVVTAA
ncbi:CocE/NonD family hydrolase [Mycobacterium sp. IDR2000157661]|uniref:CocE/NonD family hydrolase n=1 Tax=Mycobacterium sp. IDR2000157661 TaxID=2867005 RepID=UPI001EE9B610|nr:CocE/NonD family hydrolase [Mycobacterium sp. IDR2000157661]ULE34095.1 peptidase S15 [Mycobacterium sp. IDR2000157661]